MKSSARIPKAMESISLTTSTQKDVNKIIDETSGVRRDFRFWGVIAAILVSAFTSALDLTAVATALPSIIEDLQGTQFVWVGSAYALASTAVLPAIGGLAETFGRRPIFLACIFLFAVGSALCGAAPTMSFLVAGRTTQGFGSGGIVSLTQIVIADMVPLNERGTFQSYVGAAWALAALSGPITGGALANAGQWRWLFYLNLFTTAFAAILIIAFMRLKTPPGSLEEKLRRIDYSGSLIVASATTSTIIALTWAGTVYPWADARVLVPLIIGALGLIAFYFYEARYAKFPIIPATLINTRTGASGYIQAFFGDLFLVGSSFYVPVYLQACQGYSSVISGVRLLGVAIVCALFSVISGVSVAKLKSYRAQLWFGWVMLTVSSGLFSTMKADSPRYQCILYGCLLGVGLGIMLSVPFFPVLAPLRIEDNAHALALYTFLRSFGRVWALTIGATVLQNYLKNNLPMDFVAQFPGGSEIAFGIIPIINQIPEPLRGEIRGAFGEGLAQFWQVMIGIGGLGFLASLLMKHIPLHAMTDGRWGAEEEEELKPPRIMMGQSESTSEVGSIDSAIYYQRV